MTHVSTTYQMMHPTGDHLLGWFDYPSVDEAIAMNKAENARAKAKGFDSDEKWLIVKVTTATIKDNDGNFVSQTTDSKAIGVYDNGKVTMY